MPARKVNSSVEKVRRLLLGCRSTFAGASAPRLPIFFPSGTYTCSNPQKHPSILPLSLVSAAAAPRVLPDCPDDKVVGYTNMSPCLAATSDKWCIVALHSLWRGLDTVMGSAHKLDAPGGKICGNSLAPSPHPVSPTPITAGSGQQQHR